MTTSAPPPDGGGRYDAHKRRAAERQARLSSEGREIGEIPPVRHPADKIRAGRDLGFFCQHYFPDVFDLPFSPDHRKVLGQLEQAIRHGGLFALAMPRATGKTSMSEKAALWAVLNGFRRYVVLIGAEEVHGSELLDSIKSALGINERLLDDWPEVCYPIRRMEGIHQRAGGQTCGGRRTMMQWKEKRIVLPTIRGSKASGAIIDVAGLTGRIRGKKFPRPDGPEVRPDLALVDDPQTDQSARSLEQCKKRETIITGAVLGLAGPGKKIAAVMPMTIVQPNDLAARFLDRQKHPEWQGMIGKLLYAEPTNKELWARYAEFRRQGLRDGDGGRAGTEFYRQNREAMDAGAIVAWPERFEPGQISAVQYAMDLKIDNPLAYAAEYQNDPMDEKGDAALPTKSDLLKRTNGLPPGIVPDWADLLTGSVDVHASLLYWSVFAWKRSGFTGARIAHGTYPEQPVSYFAANSATYSLGAPDPRKKENVRRFESIIFEALKTLIDGTDAEPGLLPRTWQREDGHAMSIKKLAIDAQYAPSKKVVYVFARKNRRRSRILPSHGVGVTARDTPFDERAIQPGDLTGDDWIIRGPKRRRFKHPGVQYDTNAWKTAMWNALTAPVDVTGSLVFSEGENELYVDHLHAEYRVETTGRGRSLFEYAQRPERPDNHWLDTTVGSMVAASVCGAKTLGEIEEAEPRTRRRIRPL